jgi:polar amino acid transport system substrate-binding protein
VQPLLAALGRYDVGSATAPSSPAFPPQQQNAGLQIAHARGRRARLAGVRPRACRPAFRSAKVRDDFDAGLAFLRKSGRFDAICRRCLGGD